MPCTIRPLPPHMFISDTDGALHDTRARNWATHTFRANYRKQHRHIKSTADLKATLRAGPHAWPGAYPLYFITHDGAALSFEAVRAELRQCLESLWHRGNDGWRIVACAVNWEDSDLFCDHTGARIESAYGES